MLDKGTAFIILSTACCPMAMAMGKKVCYMCIVYCTATTECLIVLDTGIAFMILSTACYPMAMAMAMGKKVWNMCIVYYTAYTHFAILCCFSIYVIYYSGHKRQQRREYYFACFCSDKGGG